MSKLFAKVSEEIASPSVKFDKQSIIEDIKSRLPEPWVGYEIGNHMDVYDLIIIRNKKVREEINYTRPFSSVNAPINSIYSIVLGINVVERFTTKKVFNVIPSDAFVTAEIEVTSASNLLDILKDLDSKPGGITYKPEENSNVG